MKSSTEKEMDSIFAKLIESEKQQIAKMYGDIDVVCYGDRAYKVMKEVVEQPGYSMWKKHCYPSILYECLEYITENVVQDYNALNIE